MIFGNINNIEEYAFLEDKIKECLAYAKDNDLKSLSTGRHDIRGDELFVNIVEYETTKPENRFWEAHKDYLDLHFLLDGKEQINLNFLKNMTLGDYIKEEDYQKIEGDKNSSGILCQGDFLICYPNDGHMTAIAADEPQKIKKAIFKIKI